MGFLSGCATLNLTSWVVKSSIYFCKMYSNQCQQIMKVSTGEQ